MNKRETIQAIGNKTRMRNYDVQKVLEALIEVWSDELAAGGRIEIQNFLVLQTLTTRRSGEGNILISRSGRASRMPTTRTWIKTSPSKSLRQRIRQQKRK